MGGECSDTVCVSTDPQMITHVQMYIVYYFILAEKPNNGILNDTSQCKSHGVHSGILSKQQYEVYICLGQMNAYQVEL